MSTDESNMSGGGNQSRPLSAFVPGIKLQPQDLNNACWYASTMMLFEWYKKRNANATAFAQNAQVIAAHRQDNGLSWAAMKNYAKLVGMQVRPQMSPSPELLGSWLESRGPIWTDGLFVDWQGNVTATGGHVVVIAGIKQVPSSDLYQIYVYDPWPPNVGHAGWRPISDFVGILGAGSNPNRDVTFLQY
jgi:hypothetical protein